MGIWGSMGHIRAEGWLVDLCSRSRTPLGWWDGEVPGFGKARSREGTAWLTRLSSLSRSHQVGSLSPGQNRVHVGACDSSWHTGREEERLSKGVTTKDQVVFICQHCSPVIFVILQRNESAKSVLGKPEGWCFLRNTPEGPCGFPGRARGAGT